MAFQVYGALICLLHLILHCSGRHTAYAFAFFSWGPIYKIYYDLSCDYRKFIVRSTYDSDLTCAEISLGNIVS